MENNTERQIEKSELQIDSNGENKLKASLGLKILATILTLILGGTSFLKLLAQTENIIIAFGGFFGAIIWPLLCIGVFQIGKKFRNQKSRYTIYSWAGSVMVVIKILAIMVKA